MTLAPEQLQEPFGLLGSVQIAGHPYHGLVKSGLLTLPNGAVRPYLQPSSADAWALQLAGVPAVSRTSAQLASDAAAGHEWLSRIVISGRIPQIYGKRLPGDLPGWLWRDSSGRVWHFSLPGLATYQTQIRVRIRRFGVFNGTAIAPTDIDLAHGIDDGSSPVDLSTTADANLPTCVLRVCDIAHDGSSVIVGVYQDRRRTDYAPRNGAGYYRLPRQVESALGFVRIDVGSGSVVPSVSLATLRTYAQTMGSSTGSGSRTPAGDWSDLPTNSNGDPVGIVTEESSRMVSGRIVSMFFNGSSVAEITLSRAESFVRTRTFDAFEISVPGYGARTFAYRDDYVTDVFRVGLSVNGVEIAAIDHGALPIYGGQVAVDPTGQVLSYAPAGTSSVYQRSLYPVAPFSFTPPSTADGLNVTQYGYWPYSLRLHCLFRISGSGAVTWTQAGAPEGTAIAPAAASGGWVSDGAGGLTGGPTTWYRAVNPLTGAISSVDTSPICYV